MLPQHWEKILVTVLCAAACSQAGRAQVAPPVILQIDVANRVQYFEDNGDPSKFATDPGVTTAKLPANFAPVITIGDIVAVNGQPVKGTLWNNSRMLVLRPAPNPGQAIADTTRGFIENLSFEILNADGSQIGTIVTLGNGSGAAPPGAPLAATQGDQAVVGGTGAFLGVRGSVGSINPGRAGLANRQASITEDPANRRNNGGPTLRHILYLIPMTRPEVAVGASGPAVFHADFSPVTAAQPAKAGEILIAMARGLGPTRPGVDPGQPFPQDTLQPVNSPVAVLVNGKQADVINAIGWPGRIDTYRVDFRVPDGTAAGMAAIQLTAAWIAGSEVNIPTQ